MDPVTTVERCRALIGAAFPELAAARITPLGAGWDCTTFVVDDRLVFRIPQRPAIAAALPVEVALLAELGPSLPLPVPRPDHVAPPTLDFPWSFAGYPLLPGVPLDPGTLVERAAAAVATDLGRFLAALHRFPVERAAALGVPVYAPDAWVDRTAVLWRRARPIVAERLGADLARSLDAAWAARLADPALQDFTPTLIHGDLSPEHVLVDAGSARVSGVIDFGDTLVADPALDYAGFPEAFARALLAASGERGDASFWARRALCVQAAPLHGVIAGVDLGRDDLLAEGMARLERLSAREARELWPGLSHSGRSRVPDVEASGPGGKGGRVIETETFEDLIDRHQGEIYAYLLRMVRDDSEAQDLCQDVFLRAYRAFGDLEGAPNYRAWLYRIATNLALNAIRHRRNGERVTGVLASLGVTSIDEDHAGDLGRRELLDRVEAAIGTLPLKQRVAFTQRRFLGLTYAEIAAATGSTEEGARANVYQAVRKLRGQFSAELNEVGI